MELFKYKDLIKELVIRDIKVKYKKSVLGILWSILNPLLMMIVLSIVFSEIFKSSTKNFPLYLITGQVIFNFFSEATNMSMMSILGNSGLIKKVYLPKYIFPLSKTLFGLVNLIFSLIAVFIVILFTKQRIGISSFFIPLLFIYITAFSLGIGFILSSTAVFFRDILHLYSILLIVWNYLTPVFYPLEIVPDKYRSFISLNPMTYYVDYFRKILLYNEIPDFNLNLICFLVSIISLVIGLLIFRKNQNKFILFI